MNKVFDLERILSRGIRDLVGDALKVIPKRPENIAFWLTFARRAKAAAKRRHEAELSGEHIPPFLIMSITTECNLRCAGCYACHGTQSPRRSQLPAAEWARLFGEAAGMGVSMVLLAGGEPLMRRDVLECAARQRKILFPVFTNGTLWDENFARLFKKNRNLVPMLSLEGNRAETDARRGGGVHDKVRALMAELHGAGLLFGASVTVTGENLPIVTGDAFIEELRAAGCGVILFVEYVPVESRELALDDAGRAELDARVRALRGRYPGQIVLSFPGDERETGGCLAAGRGFFHINAAGGAEPCPFSPYSDTDVRGKPLREALRSPLFARVRTSEMLGAEHAGGCVLFEKKELVEQLAKTRQG